MDPYDMAYEVAKEDIKDSGQAPPPLYMVEILSILARDEFGVSENTLEFDRRFVRGYLRGASGAGSDIALD